mgnify:CR=1 FL=1
MYIVLYASMVDGVLDHSFKLFDTEEKALTDMNQMYELTMLDLEEHQDTIYHNNKDDNEYYLECENSNTYAYEYYSAYISKIEIEY